MSSVWNVSSVRAGWWKAGMSAPPDPCRPHSPLPPRETEREDRRQTCSHRRRVKRKKWSDWLKCLKKKKWAKWSEHKGESSVFNWWFKKKQHVQEKRKEKRKEPVHPPFSSLSEHTTPDNDSFLGGVCSALPSVPWGLRKASTLMHNIIQPRTGRSLRHWT